MKLSEIWIDEECGVTTRTHELVMHFDDGYRLSVNLQNSFNGGGLDAIELADALSRAADVIRSRLNNSTNN